MQVKHTEQVIVVNFLKVLCDRLRCRLYHVIFQDISNQVKDAISVKGSLHK